MDLLVQRTKLYLFIKWLKYRYRVVKPIILPIIIIFVLLIIGGIISKNSNYNFLEYVALVISAAAIFLTPLLNRDAEKRQFQTGVNVLHIYKEQIINDLKHTEKKYYILEAGFEKTRDEIDKAKGKTKKRKLKSYLAKTLTEHNLSIKWFGTDNFVTNIKINLYDITNNQRTHFSLRMFEVSSPGTIIVPLPKSLNKGKYALHIFYKDHLGNAYEFVYFYNGLGQLDHEQSYQKFNWKRKRSLTETANVIRLNGWLGKKEKKNEK